MRVVCMWGGREWEGVWLLPFSSSLPSSLSPRAGMKGIKRLENVESNSASPPQHTHTLHLHPVPFLCFFARILLTWWASPVQSAHSWWI